MSKPLAITNNLLMIISLFTNGYQQDYYVREVCRHLPLTHGTAHNNLESLEGAGILISKMKGKIRLFSLKKTGTASYYCQLAESYKRIRFAEQYPFIDEVLNRIIPFCKGPVALFGSYAYGNPTKDSDIDIFVVGDYDHDEVARTTRKFNVRVNVKSYQRDLFINTIRDDFLIREVYKSHVFLSCPDFFIREVMK